MEDTGALRLVPKCLDLLALQLRELVSHLLRSNTERGLVVKQVVRLSLVFRVVVSEDPVVPETIVSYRSTRDTEVVFVYLCVREGATCIKSCDCGTPMSSYTWGVISTRLGS